MNQSEGSLTYRRRRKIRKDLLDTRRPNLPPPDSDLNSGNFLQLQSSPTPYQFDSRIRMTNSMKEMEAKIKSHSILIPIFPNIFSVGRYLSARELVTEFKKIGFQFIFDDNVPVFEQVVHEFAYSFLPEYHIVPEEESDLGIMEKHVVSWKFRLGGRDFSMGMDDLRKVFGVEEHLVVYPHATREVKTEFWRYLTDLDEDYVPSQLASKIRYPFWKFVHRLIATCIYLRPDGGRFVTQNDFELMCCMRANVAANPIIIITRALEVPKISRGAYLGGGHFITTLARFLGFLLDDTRAFPIKILGHEEMLRRGFIKKLKTPEGTQWILADQMPPPAPTQAYPPLTAGPPSPDPVPEPPLPMEGFQELLGRMGVLTTKVEGLANYTYEGFRWQGDMMRNIHNHFRIPGFVEPPPHPFWPGSSSHAHAQRQEEDDAMNEEQTDRTNE